MTADSLKTVRATHQFDALPIISAAPGEQFRGIAVVPEPASIGILGAAAFGLLLRRRRA
jgi:hypothetical protein